MAKRAVVGHECVACGTCAKACPFSAISVPDGRLAVVNPDLCVGCGTCAKACPAEVISIEKTDEKRDPAKPRPKPVKRERKWYDYLYVITPIYLTLGFFNILFAWIGLLFFFLPLIFAAAGKGKLYCNRYCDRGQFFDLLGKRFGISRRIALPRWIPAARRFVTDSWRSSSIDVRQYAAGDLACSDRLAGARHHGAAAVDVPAAVALGLPGRGGAGRGAVRLRILRRHADVDGDWPVLHAAVQAAFVVRVLPHGNDDAADFVRSCEGFFVRRMQRRMRSRLRSGMQYRINERGPSRSLDRGAGRAAWGKGKDTDMSKQERAADAADARRDPMRRSSRSTRPRWRLCSRRCRTRSAC